MSLTFRLALLFAALFAGFKMVLHYSGLHETHYELVIFANILLVLLMMVFGLWAEKKKSPEKRSYTDDVKASMRSAALYAIFVSVFVFIYYRKIDPEFSERRVAQRVELAENVDFQALKESDPTRWAHMTREDFIDDEKEKAEALYSPLVHTTLTLVGITLLSFFYALLLAVLWRKVLYRIME